MSTYAMNAVLHGSKTKGGARLVLVVIADGINKDTDEWNAKIATIETLSNYKERMVQRMISRLIEMGELIVIAPAGGWQTFYIPLYPGEDGYAPVECHATDHVCTGLHTPLSVNRLAMFQEKMGIKPQTKQVRGRPRKSRGMNDSTPPKSEKASHSAKGVHDSTPPPVQEYTPPRTGVHPPVNGSAPITYRTTSSITSLDTEKGDAASEYDPDVQGDVRRWQNTREGQAYLFRRAVKLDAPFSTIRYMLREWLKEGGAAHAV